MPKDSQEPQDKSDAQKKTATPSTALPTGARSGKPVEPRKLQYLIAARQAPGLQPFALDMLEDSLRRSPEIEVVDTIAPKGVMGLFSTGDSMAQKVIVAKMSPLAAGSLQQNAGAQLVVEQDHPLRFAMPQDMTSFTVRDPGVAIPHGAGFTATFTVVGNGAAVANADVYLLGSIWPVQGSTDANGQVTLTLAGESPETVQALYVKPQADFWSLYLPHPAILPDQNNVVGLTPLGQTLNGFPDQQILGWGQKAMRLDQAPPSYRGRGVRVGVIDSGAAITHRDLQQQIKAGFDVVAKNNQSWRDDTVFHGSHCAGVIAGRADNNVGIRGFAPEAEVLVCKIFPGGMFSHLLSALDYCIEQQVDVINLSLGSDQTSEILEQRLQKARQAGIACIVAAGNTGGPVQYPASSPNVLAVAAMGKRGEFPPDSYHSVTEYTGVNAQVSPEGYFSAKFSCFGPEIAVCAPGVAVLSSVPADGYAAWDGTSMAAPHVTGLAALVLAHHPDFQGPYKAKNSQRVDRLFDILRRSARPLNFGDRNRSGAGLPDCVAALQLQPQTGPQSTASPDVLQRLLDAIQASSPVARTPADLKSVMQDAGLLPANGAAPQMTPASAGPIPSPGSLPSATVLKDRLRTAMQDAGLMAGANEPAYAGAPQSKGANDALTNSLKRAGLL